MGDIRYDRCEDLWHLMTDYYDFTGSKAGELVKKICLNSRSTAHYMTYADKDECQRTVLTAEASVSGVIMAIEMFAEDNEKEALTAVLKAVADTIEGDAYESNRSYAIATKALAEITPKDPDVWWEECSPGTLWMFNDWIDEVPVMVKEENDKWNWSLSRDRDKGTEDTKEAAMRAGEKALGFSEKPFK